jgi:hypothetical protein
MVFTSLWTSFFRFSIAFHDLRALRAAKKIRIGLSSTQKWDGSGTSR